MAVCPVVTTTASSGAGSLRECITLANANTGHDTITFDAAVFNPGTIVLDASLPALDDPAGATIDGANAAQVIIDGAAFGGGTGFRLNAGNNQLRNLTVRGFLGGGFGSGAAVWIRSGSTGNTLANTVLEDNQGEAVVFDGSNAGNHITDNVLRRNGSFGVLLRSSQAPCTQKNVIARNVIADNGALRGSDGIYIVGSSCVDVLENTLSGSDNDALRLAASTTSVFIYRNVFRDNPNEGVGIFSGSVGNRVSFNTFKNNGTVAILVGDTATVDNIIEGNLIVGTNGTGIRLYGGSDGARVVHNTVARNTGAGVDIGAGVTRVRVQNNIFEGNGGQGLNIAALDTVVDHNLFFSNQGGDCVGSPCAPGTGNQSCAPAFTAPAMDDFSLAGCANCAIDTGLDLGPEQPDLTPADDGGTFYGTAPDLGAFESACGAPPVFDSSPPTSAECDRLYQYDLRATSPTPVSFAAVSVPEGLSVDAATGEVRWTPRQEQVGPQPVVLAVTNASGTSEQRFSVEVACTRPPLPAAYQVGCGCGAAAAAGWPWWGWMILATALPRCPPRRRFPGCRTRCRPGRPRRE